MEVSHTSRWRENILGQGNSKWTVSETEETWHVWESAERSAWLQWGEHVGLWSAVRLKSQESDQTASLAMIRSLDSSLRVVGSQWFPAGV